MELQLLRRLQIYLEPLVFLLVAFYCMSIPDFEREKDFHVMEGYHEDSH